MARLRICRVCIDIYSSFAATRTYLTQVQDGIGDTRKRLLDDLDTRIAELGDEPDEADIDIEQQSVHHITEDQFPRQAAYAGVILTVSTIEVALKAFCKALAKNVAGVVRLNDSGGENFIDQVRAFFEANQLPSPHECYFAKSKELSRLRNLIAHHAGLMSTAKRRLVNYVKTTRGVSDDSGSLWLEHDYIMRHLDGLYLMFSRLLPQLGYTSPHIEVLEDDS